MSTKTIKGYQVKLVDKWDCPKGGGTPLITSPNIYKALHSLAPRTIVGRKAWDIMRRQCYTNAHYRCEICGAECERPHCHEVYSTNWKEGYAVFERCICVDPICHIYGIHSGRAITLHKRGNPLYPADKMLAGAENVFKLVYEYNQKHPKKKLRVYSTFLDYLDCDDLRDGMQRLIDKYEVEFYHEDDKKVAPWGQWRLKVGDNEYPTPYKNQKEWQKAMDEKEAKDETRHLKDPFSGGIFDEIKKELGGTNG